MLKRMQEAERTGKTQDQRRNGVPETDEVDARPFRVIKNLMCGSSRQLKDVALVDVEDDDVYGIEDAYKRVTPIITRAEMLSDTYKMDYPKRGKALVFSFKVFSKKLQQSGYGERKGTDIDASKISRRLQLLGFDVLKCHDLTVAETFKVLRESAHEDHSTSDCFACVILSHGLKDTFFACDGEINLNDVFTLFKGNNCKSLAGKPKLFFVQACRGNQFDQGVGMNVVDAERFSGEIPSPDQNEIRIPNEADFLIAYSTVPGFYSWRNSTRGSWFIQSLVNVLDKFGTITDIMRIMTRVNQLVAYNFESNTAPEDPKMHGMKQASCVTSMLTKDLYFTPKENIQLR